MDPTNIPSPEFTSVMSNFIDNVQNTFPEYTSIIQKWCTDMSKLWVFCKKKYIPNKGNILSKNVDIFDEHSTHDTEFLPHIHFKNLWQYDGITEHTKDAIWGYLRLTLVSIDDTQIDLDECLVQVQELFSKQSTVPIEPVPSEVDTVPEPPTDIGELDNLFGGVLGTIAKDLATDMLNNPEYNCTDAGSVQEAMSNLFSNPSKIATIFKKVSDKLDQKMSSGEIDNSDILRETNSLFTKMQGMPGLKDSNIFKDISKHLDPVDKTSRGKENIKDRLRKKAKK